MPDLPGLEILYHVSCDYFVCFNHVPSNLPIGLVETAVRRSVVIYDPILYRFQDKAKYWSKIAISSYPFYTVRYVFQIKGATVLFVITYTIVELVWQKILVKG